MKKKTLDTALDGILRLEEETLSDNSKVFNVRLSGDYNFAATGKVQAESIFIAVSKLLRN